MTVISLSFIIFHLSFSRVAAQTTVEYWFDHDPGLGLATQTVAPTDAAGNVQFEVPTDALNVGNHLMGVRTVGIDAEGKPFYGPTLTQQVGIQRAAYDGSISRLEYFWDEEPGAGKGLPIAFTPGEVVTLQDAELSTEGLQPGRHVLHVRAFSGFGWGPTISQEVMVTGGALSVDFVEYFWDSDPGMGKATPLPVVAGKELTLENIELSTADLTPGLHNLGIRSRSGQSWGPTIYLETYVPMRVQQAVVSGAEYFWNEDPGYGQGTPISLTPADEVTLDALGIPTTDIHGDALFFIRYRGPYGWSPTLCYKVMVDAEGNYTLNAQAATSIDTRNYQTLGEAVVDLFAHTWTENVALTINGTAYDFTSWAKAPRYEELCAEVATTPVSIAVPAEGMTVSYTAQPANGTVLSGFAAEATATLPAMTIANSGSKTEALPRPATPSA